jgi:hypothetical protein
LCGGGSAGDGSTGDGCTRAGGLAGELAAQLGQVGGEGFLAGGFGGQLALLGRDPLA